MIIGSQELEKQKNFKDSLGH